MERETWDKIEVGDVIHTSVGPFKVHTMDRYFRSAADRDQGRMTVVRLENEKHESMMWGHYVLSSATLEKPKQRSLPRLIDVRLDGDYVDFYVEWEDHVDWIGLTPDELMPLIEKACIAEYGG